MQLQKQTGKATIICNNYIYIYIAIVRILNTSEKYHSFSPELISEINLDALYKLMYMHTCVDQHGRYTNQTQTPVTKKTTLSVLMAELELASLVQP